MMKNENKNVDRRGFLKTAGAAGIAASFANMKNVFGAGRSQTVRAEPNKPSDPNAARKEQAALIVPKKDLGKTGVKVPCLGLGMMYNVVDNQLILRSSLKYGVTYWDTANNYGGGNSELGIGNFFQANPEERKNVFLVSKASGANSVAQIEERLKLSFERLKTNYIDLYDYPHGLNNPSELNDDVKKWVENAKKNNQIKYFGFSAHSNQAAALETAVKLGWIDVVMISYNYRLAQDAALQKAIDACYNAKIGIVAMKAAGSASSSSERGPGGRGGRGGRGGDQPPAASNTSPSESQKLAEKLLARGFTQIQAAIKLVMDDQRISCVNVGMDNVLNLTANVAASLDKDKLTAEEQQAFRQYAQATCSGYCAGCSKICDSALRQKSYVSDIMRYLMYYNSYGSTDMARELFAQIPSEIRSNLLQTDYSIAEAHCPQRMPISQYIAEAVEKLA
jgi:uncharacterized protein